MKLELNDLRRFAADIRIQTIRSMETFGSSHIGGCMSMADVLAVLYGKVMRYRAEDPNWEGRDLLVISKGHCGPAQYEVLALSGFSHRIGWGRSTRAEPACPAIATTIKPREWTLLPALWGRGFRSRAGSPRLWCFRAKRT